MTAEDPHRRGGKWLPSDSDVQRRWLSDRAAEVAKRPEPFHPVIADFERFIESDARAFMLFNQMFEQVPRKALYDKEPAALRQVRDYKTMLQLLNAIVTRAPEYDRTGVVGIPINAILDWSMGTEAGYAAFLDEKVNAHLRVILDEWGRFLKSPASCAVLNDDPRKGWFGEDAIHDMPDFDRDFVCDPGAPHRGFASWDDFFTRRFRPGVRAVASPDDDDVIVNPCESAPYRLAHGVAERDRFWIKGQPYSLAHMLAGDSLAPQFVGGSVYQAFLSALSYHRWHSPVSGTVVKACLRPGTYYSEPPAEHADPATPDVSQGYISHVATRAMIFIRADNPALGLICFMPVGMAEVSTCEIGVYEGQHIAKGEEIGMFHFGGSSFCLLFRPNVAIDFDLQGQKPGLHSSNIPVCGRLAKVNTGRNPSARGADK